MSFRQTKNVIVPLLLSVMLLLGCPQTDIDGQVYGGNKTDVANSVRALSDGGAIVAGSTSSYGASSDDAYLFRTDAEGNELWHKRFGGALEDTANAVRVLEDGGFALAGQYTYSDTKGLQDMYLVRTDENGNKVWEKTYGGDEGDVAQDVIALDDGGFLLVGHTASFEVEGTDAYVVRTYADGEERWSETYGDADYEYIFAAQELEDGDFALAGTVYSDATGTFAALLIRINSDGDEEWTKTYEGAYDNVALGVQELADGGFVLAGWTTSYGADEVDGYLVRTDKYGNEKWHKKYGGLYDDALDAVQVLSDGRFAAAGHYASKVAGEISDDAYLVVTSDAGIEQWSATYGGKENDLAQDLDLLPDGGFILAGWTDSVTTSRAAYVVRTDASGTVTN